MKENPKTKNKKKNQNQKENQKEKDNKIIEEKNKIDKESKQIEKEKDSKPDNNNTPKQKSLFERNKKTKFVYYNIMRRMDEYAFARSITLFAILSFFLGNNLNIFLWMFLATSIYVLSYRLVRFWIRRYLLYLFEFCYFGFLILMYFLLFDNSNMKLFSICFICNTGLMTIAIIVFNNQTIFNSTDHLTSSWVHTLPLIVDWSIRWRHIIYPKETLQKLNFNFQNLEDLSFGFDLFNFSNFSNSSDAINSLDKEIFIGLIVWPFVFWIIWAFVYFLLMGVIFKSFREDNRYGDGLTDFVEFFKNKKICGNTKNFSMLKYLFQHFLFFLFGYPIGILAFYNYYFNTLYLIFIMVFLAWNTVRNSIKKQKKKLSEVEEDDY